jgi:phage shock protein PspC (stress-responsive transcriptional regulator)
MDTTATPRYEDASLESARQWFAERGLSRPKERRLLGGVSASLARRYDTSLLVMRLATLAGAIILTPLLYVALWILMPSEA